MLILVELGSEPQLVILPKRVGQSLTIYSEHILNKGVVGSR